jgi:hypothetical protein
LARLSQMSLNYSLKTREDHVCDKPDETGVKFKINLKKVS